MPISKAHPRVPLGMYEDTRVDWTILIVRIDTRPVILFKNESSTHTLLVDKVELRVRNRTFYF